MSENKHERGLEINISFPGEKLLLRLIDLLLDKGLASYLAPFRIRQQGAASIDVERLRALTSAQTEKDIEAIRNGRKRLEDFSSNHREAGSTCDRDAGGPRIEPILDLPKTIAVARYAAFIDDARREVNLAKAILQAADSLKGDSAPPPDEEVDEDWLFRWREYASEVSLGDLQVLWGRLLAGEVKYPGTFSLRTLEFIRSLSSIEASEIAQVLQFTIGTFLWGEPEQLTMSAGCRFNLLLRMQDLGVINGVGSLLEMHLSSQEEGYYYHLLPSHGKALVIRDPDPKRVIRLSSFSLTELGRQLVRLGRFEPHLDYLKALAVHLIQTYGVTVCICDTQESADGALERINEQVVAVH